MDLCRIVLLDRERERKRARALVAVVHGMRHISLFHNRAQHHKAVAGVTTASKNRSFHSNFVCSRFFFLFFLLFFCIVGEFVFRPSFYMLLWFVINGSYFLNYDFTSSSSPSLA